MSPPPLLPAERHYSKWQLLFLLLGLLLLVGMVARVGVRALLAQALGIGWYFVAIVLLFSAVHLLRAFSWRLCLNEPGRGMRFGSLCGLWLAGEAVSHLSFAWSGEAFRALTTRPAISLERGLSAQLVSRVLYAYASLWWVAAGLVLAWQAVGREGTLDSIVFLGTLVTAALLVLTTAALLAGGGTITPLTQWLARLGWQNSLLTPMVNFLRVLESDLAVLAARERRVLGYLLGVNLVAAFAGVVEVYLVLRGLGVPVSLSGSAIIEAFNKLLALCGYFVPGNIGVREAGNVLILQLFGFAAVAGLNLALIRRARALVWVAVGAVVVLRLGLAPWVLSARPAEAVPVDKLAKDVSLPR